jgi:cell fate regulator YaaT (PSP1 superfamily)
MAKRYVGVSFRCSRRIYCFEVGALHLKVNDEVVVETDRGVNMGQVVVPSEIAILPDGVPVESVKRVLRKARDDDFEKLKDNSRRELDAAKICHEKIESFKLKMKLVRAEFMHDGNRVIFYFTAENRVDFRELVKDLAHTLHVRVEMRQIGIRDAAGMLGGVGICGRELCCASFLSTFDPVTVKMAKEQNLALNPMKISGICGRLMCCLGYEYENYRRSAGDRKNGGRRRGGKGSGSGAENRRAQDSKNNNAGKDAAAKAGASPKENSGPGKNEAKGDNNQPLKSPTENPAGQSDSPAQNSEAKNSQQQDSRPKDSGAKKPNSAKSGQKKSGNRGSRSRKGSRGNNNRGKRKS